MVVNTTNLSGRALREREGNDIALNLRSAGEPTSLTAGSQTAGNTRINAASARRDVSSNDSGTTGTSSGTSGEGPSRARTKLVGGEQVRASGGLDSHDLYGLQSFDGGQGRSSGGESYL